MTEKNYNPNQKEKKAMKKQGIVQTPKKQLKKEIPKTKVEDKKERKVNEKVILVDAVHCIVDKEGNANKELKSYLDSLPNKKIILTNAPKEKHGTLFKNVKNYEIFTLENNPNKKDPIYYKKFLEKYKLTSNEVIYFEHDEESVKSAKSNGIKTILYKNNIVDVKKFIEENKPTEEKTLETQDKKPEKKETPKKEAKPEEKKKEVAKVKKDESVVNGRSVPVSTKYAIEICKFIKYKPIDIAINDLEQVLIHKKAIPMKGEYGHKKGKRMAGGKYPKKATEHFIKLLKSLSANAIANGLDEPIIVEAISNVAPRPMARFGRWQRKRTHIKIVACEKKEQKEKKSKKRESKK